MTSSLIVTGTDTGVGKTVFAAALAGALDGAYWKPIQCGLDDGGDTGRVRALSGLADDRILAEAYRFKLPASPHIAAKHEGVDIDLNRLARPRSDRPIVIEGAGGLMVPLRPDLLQIDLFDRWQLPIVLVARTGLGTINHTLLSLEALRRRSMSVLGVAFIGDESEEAEQTIATLGRTHHLGRLPFLKTLEKASLAEAFRKGFSVEDFTP
jgi:dethiobiotin synthetase